LLWDREEIDSAHNAEIPDLPAKSQIVSMLNGEALSELGSDSLAW